MKIISQSLSVAALTSSFVLSACSNNHTVFMSEQEQQDAINTVVAEKKATSLDGEGIAFWDRQNKYGVIFSQAVKPNDIEAAKYKKIYDNGSIRYIFPSAPVVYGDQLSLPNPAYAYEDSSYKPQYTVKPEAKTLCRYKTDDCVSFSSVTDPVLNNHIQKIVTAAKPS